MGSGPSATNATTPCQYIHTKITTSTSNQQALPANTNAKYRYFQNIDNAQPIALFFGGAASNAHGIVLFPFQSFECSLAKGNLDNRVVNCITPFGSAILLITEGV